MTYRREGEKCSASVGRAGASQGFPRRRTTHPRATRRSAGWRADPGHPAPARRKTPCEVGRCRRSPGERRGRQQCRAPDYRARERGARVKRIRRLHTGRSICAPPLSTMDGGGTRRLTTRPQHPRRRKGLARCRLCIPRDTNAIDGRRARVSPQGSARPHGALAPGRSCGTGWQTPRSSQRESSRRTEAGAGKAGYRPTGRLRRRATCR
jgi:hypothetical protein